MKPLSEINAVTDPAPFAMNPYEQVPDPQCRFQVGHIVRHSETGTIGIVLQTQGNGHIRVNEWGNCHESECLPVTWSYLMRGR